MKLQETLKGLICEIASVDSVFNAIKNKIGIQDLITPVISIYFISEHTSPSGGKNIKRKRKTIKKNRKNRMSKKVRYCKR